MRESGSDIAKVLHTINHSMCMFCFVHVSLHFTHYLSIFYHSVLSFLKSCGDEEVATLAGAGWHWKLLVTILRTSGISKMVVCSLSGVKPAFGPTGVPKQNFLATALLASHEGGLRKGDPTKAHPLYPTTLPQVAGHPVSCGRLKRKKHQFVVAS